MSFGIIFNAIFLVVIAVGVGLVAYTLYKTREPKINILGAVIAVIGLIG